MPGAWQLWGLATHPLASNIVVTTGDDRTIRLWDIGKHVLLKKVTVDAMSRCVPQRAALPLGRACVLCTRTCEPGLPVCLPSPPPRGGAALCAAHRV